MPQTESERGSDPAGRFVAEFIDDYEAATNPELPDYLDRVPEEYRAEVRRRCQAFLSLQSALELPEEPPPPDDDREIPGPLGDFTPLSILGRGGMGTVYLADQLSLGRKVALKVLTPHLANSPRRRERFRREALAVAKLRHPNIVQVLSYGEEQDAHYLAMEYIDGQSLADIIREMREAGPDRESTILHALGAPETHDTPTSGRLPTSRSRVVVAAGIALRVCEALSFAHAQGIIHRDVKPSNILLRDGVPLLVDFGLAIDLDDSRLSLSGDVIGTPHYMSPEQARRQQVDARTDVYSLGVTLYELVTGQLPFEGDGLAQILDQVQTREPVPPRKIRENVPLDLETIILKCMEKNADRRYASVDELGADLRCFLELRPISARPIGALTRSIRKVRQHPTRFLSLTLMLVVVLAAPIIWTLRETADRQQSRADQATAQRDGLRLLAESTTALRRSPGLALALSVEGAGLVGGLHANNVIYEAWRASTGPGRELRTHVGHSALVRDVRYSPDGTLIASGSEDATVRLWGVSDGSVRHLLEGHQSEVGGVAFHPKGHLLVSASSDATARVWDVETGECLRVLVGHDGPLSFARFVGSTERIVTASVDGTVRLWDGTESEVFVSDLKKLEYSRYIDYWGYAPSWIDLDGSNTVMVTACYNGVVRVHDLLSRKQLLKLQLNETGVQRVHIAPNRAFITTIDFGQVCSWDLTGRLLGEIGFERPINDAVPSSDGSCIAIYHRRHLRPSTKTIQLLSPDLQTTLRSLSMDSEIGPIEVRFSKSGQFIIALDPSSTSFVWEAATGKPIAQLIGHETQVLCASFSPDELNVVTGAEDAHVRTWQLSEDPFIHHYARHDVLVGALRVSQDGRLLASGSIGDGLSVVDVNRGDPVLEKQLDSSVRQLRFHQDNIFTVSSVDISLIDLKTGEKHWSVPSPTENWLIEAGDLRPDGKTFVCAGRYRLDGWAMICNTVTGTMKAPLRGHVKAVRSACYSPDGQMILTGSLDGTARTWNADDGSGIRTYVHGADVRDANFSNDGKRIVTGGWDRIVRIWDVKSGELLTTLTAHSHSVESCMFSPDDQYIVTASLDGTVRVWQEDQCVAVLDHGGWARCATFGPQGKQIFVGTDTGSIYRWPFPPLEAARARVPRQLTAAEKRRFTGESNPIPVTRVPQLALDLRQSWESVHGPNRPHDHYRQALGRIQALAERTLDPELFSDLLGAALIRCGDFQAGLEALEVAERRELQSTGRVSILVRAFKVLGLSGSGRQSEAREVFGKLEKHYHWVKSPRVEIDTQHLFAEAQAAVEE